MLSRVLKNGPTQPQPLAMMQLGHPILLRLRLHTLTTKPMVLASTSSSLLVERKSTHFQHPVQVAVRVEVGAIIAATSTGLIGTLMAITSFQHMLVMTRVFTIGWLTLIWTMMDI